MEQEISEEQAGFRAGIVSGTRDQIVNLRIITEKAREFNTRLFLCFIDYKKAFNSVLHDQLRLVMLEMGFSAHIVQLISKLYHKQEAVVRTNKHMTSWVQYLA